MKILPLGAKLFHADRYEKANSRLPPFCERANKAVDL